MKDLRIFVDKPYPANSEESSTKCEYSDILNLVDVEETFWKDTCHLPHEKTLQFRGVALTLRPDGTYSLSDTTG